MIKGLLIGLLAGFVIAWALFGDTERVVVRDSPARAAPLPPVEQYEADGDSWDPPPTEGDEPADPAKAEKPVDVQELIRDADRARADNSWNDFRAALTQLGAAGTREAQEKLVELMGDPSLKMRGRMGQRFLKWLGTSSVPGIVGAARTRIEQEALANPGQAAAYDGWLALVATHGGPAEYGWIDELAKDKKIGRAAGDAYVQAAARPEAAARVAQMFEARDQPWFPSRWRALGSANPKLMRTLVESSYKDAKEHERVALGRAYGAVVDAKSLPQARRFLSSLATEHERIGGVYAVQTMARSGLSIAGLESVTAAPVEALERMSANPKRNLREFYRALNAIRVNPVTWSARTATALDEAAKNVDARMALVLKTTAAKVRTGIDPGAWK